MPKKVIFILIILIGITMRFYKLDWGDGLFPHPDERNIAGGIMNLSFPSQMNPKFFAYGGFPLYLYYFTGYVLNIFFPKISFLAFDNTILIGRFWSAFFSSVTLIFFYLFCKKFFSQNLALFATLLLVFVPGVVQQAHFATVETLLSFFLIMITYLCIKYLESDKKKFILLASIMGGLAVGTKISALLFLPPIFLAILMKGFFQPLVNFMLETRKKNLQLDNEIKQNKLSEDNLTGSLISEDLANNFIPSRHSGKPRIEGRIQNLFKLFKLLFNFILLVTFALLLMAIMFILTNPFALLDYESFRSSMNYETGVGFGNPIVFYTRQFQKTIPVIFQFTKIFPHALGPSVTFFAILGFLVFIINTIKSKKLTCYMLLISCCLYLIPNLLIFAKWTRFVSPVFPFFVFFAVYFLTTVIPEARSVIQKMDNNPVILACPESKYYSNGPVIPEARSAIRNLFKYILISLLLFSTLLWGLAFFSIYTKRDIRWTSSDWMIKNLKPKAQILFETGNVIDIPLGGDFTRTSYDFFHIDQNNTQEEFYAEIEKADYFLIQSRRVWANYPRLPETHPTTAKFYDLLWSGKLGFEKIAEFDSFPQISGVKINDELAEETFTVFDHPHMTVWKKSLFYNINDYLSLF